MKTESTGPAAGKGVDDRGVATNWKMATSAYRRFFFLPRPQIESKHEKFCALPAEILLRKRTLRGPRRWGSARAHRRPVPPPAENANVTTDCLLGLRFPLASLVQARAPQAIPHLLPSGATELLLKPACGGAAPSPLPGEGCCDSGWVWQEKELSRCPRFDRRPWKSGVSRQRQNDTTRK